MKIETLNDKLSVSDWHLILKKTTSFLLEILAFPSLPGKEEPLQKFIYEAFKELSVGKTELVPLTEEIKNDPEYSKPMKPLNYREKHNVLLTIGKGNGKSLILNAHSDVVPGKEWERAFSPVCVKNRIYGRGAVDCKGQIAVIYAILLAMKALGWEPKGKIFVEIVVEEEIGGNGTLALVREGPRADSVIVLEASDGRIYAANRGALWFKIEVKGKSTHMGRKWEGVSAIEKGIEIIKALMEYEKRLLAESKHPLFDSYKNPVQVNVGKIQGGEWPASVPDYLVLEGGIGFLPNKNIPLIKKEIKATINAKVSDWTRKNHSISFDGLHNEAYAIDPDHPLVKTLFETAKIHFGKSEIAGMSASCDARLFWHLGKMPVVVFGAGSLERAHSYNEWVSIEEIEKTAKALLDFIYNWCEKVP